MQLLSWVIVPALSLTSCVALYRLYYHTILFLFLILNEYKQIIIDSLWAYTLCIISFEVINKNYINRNLYFLILFIFF